MAQALRRRAVLPIGPGRIWFGKSGIKSALGKRIAAMQLVKSQPAYSYLDDPDVPAFDHDGPVTFMDGDCVLCTTGARMIARFDRKNEFRICRVQTNLGQAMLRHYGLDPNNPESWLYLVDGKAWTSLDAMIRAGARIGGIGWLMQVFRLLPRRVQDWLYVRIARNRYAVFGRADMCAVGDAGLRARLLE